MRSGACRHVRRSEAREPDKFKKQGFEALHNAGAIVVNQTPVLRGINDDPDLPGSEKFWTKPEKKTNAVASANAMPDLPISRKLSSDRQAASQKE